MREMFAILENEIHPVTIHLALGSRDDKFSTVSVTVGFLEVSHNSLVFR